MYRLPNPPMEYTFLERDRSSAYSSRYWCKRSQEGIDFLAVYYGGRDEVQDTGALLARLWKEVYAATVSADGPMAR